MEAVRFALTAVLLVMGLFCLGVSVLGVFRFRYAATRMHAAAIGDTLGVGLCLLGLAVSAPDIFTAVKLILIVALMWVSGPVCSHLLCRLEIETNEQRDKEMTVHTKTLNEEEKGEEA